MITTAKKILAIIGPDRHLAFAGLLCLFIVTALIELLGITSILPLIKVLASPESIESNNFLLKLYHFSGAETVQTFTLILSFFVLGVLFLTNVFMAFSQWVTLRFGASCDYFLSTSLLKKYLSQPYKFHTQRHSSELSKNCLQEINILTYQVIIPILIVISKSISAVFIIGLLVYADTALAMMTGLLLGGFYMIVYIFYRHKTIEIGKERLNANTIRYKTVNDAFNCIKDIKTIGLEKLYYDYFTKPAELYSFSSAKNQIIRQLPRYFIEIAAFGAVILIIIYFILLQRDINETLPILSLYAIAGYRIIPALQQIFSNALQLRFAMPTLDIIYNEYQSLREYPLAHKQTKKLSFTREIKFKNISFAHANHLVIKKISFSIKKGQKIGIVGTTGAGKTTFTDVLLGLYDTYDGSIFLDSTLINRDNQDGFKRNLSYVSQTICLFDESVANNITMGMRYNRKRMIEACKKAKINDFIETELPQKYNTVIGENGVLLSGGQKQRIGMARAFYRQSDILILDEATSALDNETESQIMDEIYKSSQTVIIIAHRLSTLKKCDVIHMFDKGELVKSGSFNHLKKNNKQFEALVNKGRL